LDERKHRVEPDESFLTWQVNQQVLTGACSLPHHCYDSIRVFLNGLAYMETQFANAIDSKLLKIRPEKTI
jgi:hypothetical protein